jgi:hypothetical protein
LAVSPTWEENRHLTHEIRLGLKERDLLPKEDTACTVHDSLRWTVQQRGNWRNYQPGQVVTLTKSIGGWKASETATVARAVSGNVVLASGDQERRLPLKSAGSFDVSVPRPINVCPGDKILIRANARPLGLINGQVLTVEKIEPDEEIAGHYTFGVVRVIGHHLEAIYSLLKQHNLDFARLSEANDPCRDEVEVTRIVFENISADAGGSEL